jgi:bacterioferritin (cytochrome b1)
MEQILANEEEHAEELKSLIETIGHAEKENPESDKRQLGRAS